ncbi:MULTISPECIES: serine hydrolase domain-containing protein [Citromicrobium]|uniref:serine hydrolase domain-containing protein n=1 Tax=Citromicrobium TaxID=72173 RepID=UPI0001DD06DB|nr:MULTISPECIES: serine hydrolase domain-containing protein [Citromicrobium]ALG61634.1 beta-lactamase [Citromicrobium sp. JL477]KPM12918.1 beta-lactamase [Citromicrobium sp. JL1351]KPM21051.1 beta-lactamase [Citromicrobium sp. JL31]KPM27037.1 beta-lactamase [Citromicrobium sp. JL2201]
MKLGNPEDRGFDSERLQRIDRFLDETYLDTGRLAMMQLLVSRDGHPVHYYHGGTLRDDGTPMREDALFRIASMTKPVTSIAFMQLVEQCKVALDDPVARVLPEFEGLGAYAGGGGDLPFAPTKQGRPMRFVDLMTHMAGLTYGFQNRTSVDAAYRKARLDLSRGAITSDEYIATLAKIPLEFEPGTRWNYSVATDVLGVCVERISGMALGDYFRENIFDPLGMEDTGFDIAPAKQDRLADAYLYRPGNAPRLTDKGAESRLMERASFHSGGGGLISTLADYDRFCTMLVNRGAFKGAQIVSPKTLDLMTANHLPGGADLTQMSESLFSEASNAGTGFGLGFAVVTDPARTLMPASKGEFYWGGAYSTAFFVDPVERITCVFMTQLYPSSIYPIRRQLKTLIYSALTHSNA